MPSATLPLTTAVLAETLRLWPPSWMFSRRTREPLTLGGRSVPAGIMCLVSPALLHRDPRWWAEPEQFQPQRWLRREPGQSDRFDPKAPGQPRGAFLPFGAGPRMCIGEQFAWSEAAIMLAELGRRWRIQVTTTPLRPGPSSMTLRPKDPVKARRRHGETWLRPHATRDRFPRSPDLLGWIAVRPLGVDEVLRADGSLRGLDLDQVDYLKTVRAQQPDPIPVAEVELDPGFAGPFEAVHAEVRAKQSISRRPLVIGVGHGQHPERAIHEEDELSARAQQARGFGDPSVRIGPDARAVFADGEVEARIRQWDRFGVAMDERELEVVFGLERSRCLELLLRVVDPRHPRAAAGEPGRQVRSAAAELDHVSPCKIIWERPQVGLRHLEDAPGEVVARPGAPSRLGVTCRIHLVPITRLRST